MHPLVRDLYRRFLLVARDYPAGRAAVLDKVKAAFRANSALRPPAPRPRLPRADREELPPPPLPPPMTAQPAQPSDEEAFMRAVYAGRWWAKELVGVVQLRKYRAMRQRYGGSTGAASGDAGAEVEAIAAALAETEREAQRRRPAGTAP